MKMTDTAGFPLKTVKFSAPVVWEKRSTVNRGPIFFLGGGEGVVICVYDSVSGLDFRQGLVGAERNEAKSWS